MLMCTFTDSYLYSFGVDQTTGEEGARYYVHRMKRLAEEDRVTLYIDYAHLFAYDQVLAEAITTFYYRYVDIKLYISILIRF
jgi:hypothetical protein